jgi:hypothetical protein
MFEKVKESKNSLAGWGGSWWEIILKDTNQTSQDGKSVQDETLQWMGLSIVRMQKGNCELDTLGILNRNHSRKKAEKEKPAPGSFRTTSSNRICVTGVPEGRRRCREQKKAIQ